MLIWRASARGRPVIPGDPLATVTRTASMTLGMRPPRELRTVATLFTFTLSRKPVATSAQKLLYCAGDLGRPSLDLVLVPSLEHDPQQRLGARIPDQQPSVSAQSLFDAGHGRRNLGDRSQLFLL